MRFRLLGPLAVEGPGQHRLDGRRSRAVLAFLLLEANSLVRVEQIIDAVWGEAPPRTVRTQLHGQISAVRRWLRDVPDAQIVTHDSGYVLRTDPSRIDVEVFRRLARKGRGLTATGQPAAAAEAYRVGLRLHVGPPLGDIDAPFARAAAARLTEERLAVLADLVDLDLAAGRHHELIPRLSALVERHPWHEPLWCHLLVALDRAGRRGEAIARYHRIRLLLRHELGVEPGPELSRTYRSLLGAPPAAAVGADLTLTLHRLAEAERMLGEIRQQLSRLGVDAATARPVVPTAPSPPHVSDGGAGHAEIAA
ncbi:AfsR/SARP family transcriptional regulator [Micromonospora sp. A3M-1-15]|uniref:AfsR/SARP family transcriptional regulator n=1 Tax=Micromonospora sp. A3M-1-15 TaxID=2962035 RepID=UPI0020B889EC|nr:AfsR/SARP family transcriptional regulator [Micromonospora sp. A3M-1-15]MCP3783823.1 AfsR/SARP family transcriptional regulator [Micromonospora sp. A3M-1-15]